MEPATQTGSCSEAETEGCASAVVVKFGVRKTFTAIAGDRTTALSEATEGLRRIGLRIGARPGVADEAPPENGKGCDKKAERFGANFDLRD